MIIKITCSANMGGTTTAVQMLKPKEKVLFIGLEDVTNIFKRLYEKEELFNHTCNVDKISVRDKSIVFYAIQNFIQTDKYETLLIDNFEQFNNVERTLIEEWFKSLHSSKKRCIIVGHESPPINFEMNLGLQQRY